MTDDNKHLAEIEITWDHEKDAYFIDDQILVPCEWFCQVFGFEPKEGSYEVKFTLNHEIEGTQYDDLGRVVD